MAIEASQVTSGAPVVYAYAQNCRAEISSGKVRTDERGQQWCWVVLHGYSAAEPEYKFEALLEHLFTPDAWAALPESR